MSGPIRVLIVAAYASVRAGLHALLAEAEGCLVVGEARGSGELERLRPEARPDVVLCDDLEGEGLRVASLLSGGGVGLVLLAGGDISLHTLAGAVLPGWAVLPKEADVGEIVGALQGVAAGLIVLAPELAGALLAASVIGRPTEAAWGEALTAREREVLQLLAHGLPNKQIASRLSISAHTVKFHVASVLAKLGASSRTEAVTLGARRGDVLL